MQSIPGDSPTASSSLLISWYALLLPRVSPFCRNGGVPFFSSNQALRSRYSNSPEFGALPSFPFPFPQYSRQGRHVYADSSDEVYTIGVNRIHAFSCFSLSLTLTHIMYGSFVNDNLEDGRPLENMVRRKSAEVAKEDVLFFSYRASSRT